ncbi:hypothetical protein GCM10027432_20470 [Lysobacter fragariae]
MDFGIDIDRRPVAGVQHFLDAGFQVGDGLFEVEVVRIHAWAGAGEGGKFSRGKRKGPYGGVCWGWEGAELRRTARWDRLRVFWGVGHQGGAGLACAATHLT